MAKDVSRTRDLGSIFRYIYYGKTQSRQQIADKLCISLPTVTHNIEILISQGLIYKSGELESTGGRKANAYSCVPDARFAMGIDITRHHLSLVIINMKMDIIAKKRMRCPFSDTPEYFEHLRDEIDLMLSTSGINRDLFLGIGVSMPVIVARDHKTISYATVINLSDNLYERMAGYIEYPFLIFNDANSAGLAEGWASDPREAMTYLFLGATVGGARVSDRKIIGGDNWRFGEFGHMCIEPEGKLCYCGQRGCLDAYCAASVLSDFTNENLGRFFEELAEGNNPGFKRVFDDYLNHLAIAIKNIRMSCDSDIVLGGIVGAYLTDYIDTVRAKVSRLDPFEKGARYVKTCHYRVEASAVGAAIHYINRFVEEL